MHHHPVVGFAGALRMLFRLGLVACVACAGAVAQAQGFKSRPVTLIVPVPAGGPMDVQPRAIDAAAFE